MAAPTQIDIANTLQYVNNRIDLEYILQWRNRFPNIFIDYSIRYANNNDYHVPHTMLNRSAVVVDLKFSKEGCESMTCYPYTATGVIDKDTTPIGGYTQTSDVAIQFNQPACYHLNTPLSSRDGNIQSVELRYTNAKCYMVDTLTKVWMNSPYIRTDKHITRGVDDVPAFNVNYDDDPLFPERIKATYNSAYCRRFGRQYVNEACSQPWHEMLLSFVLGESIFTTFKLATDNVITELNNYDYEQPSEILPNPPAAEGDAMLEKWFLQRDSTVDIEAEKAFLDNTFHMSGANQTLTYTANHGFSIIRNNNHETATKYHKTKNIKTNFPESDFEKSIVDFLEDHSFIMSILTNLGVSVLESAVTEMIKQINKILIPALKRMILNQTKFITTRLLSEVYKTAVIHALERAFRVTASKIAKLTVIKTAGSIINLALMFIAIADILLMIWDPFGYNNMFPRGYLDDLSNSFLASYYDSIGLSSRDPIVFTPKNYMEYVNSVDDDDTEQFVNSLMHMVDYLSALEVNSNGQLMNLLEGDQVNDIDEQELIGAALANNNTWAYFKWYCKRHDKTLNNIPNSLLQFNNHLSGIGFALSILILCYYQDVYSNYQKRDIELTLLTLITLCVLLIIAPSSIMYYRKLTYTLNNN
uniref:p74 n=1 Tax=Adoxophyes orana granulovirus TaxID=170617 RepID=A0A0A7UYB0_GVAO|nr:P74 [Adoxophyes orana granulovirus]